VVGLRSYLVFAIPVLLAHAAVVALTYVLLVRFGVRRWASVSVATVLAFLGAGSENLLWDFQIGFVAPVALGLTAVLLYDCYDTSGWRLWPTWAALVWGLTFSSIGVVAVVLVAAYALTRRGWREALTVSALPAAVFLGWFLIFGHTGYGKGPTASLVATLLVLPTFVWTGLTHAWEGASGIPSSGPTVVLALLGGHLLPGSPRARALAVAGVVATLAQLVMAGLGRAAFGTQQAAASRYTYIVVVLTAPTLALVLDAVLARLGEPRWVGALVGLGMLALVVLSGAQQARDFRDQRVALLGDLRDRVLASRDLVASQAKLLSHRPSPTYEPDIDADLLSRSEISDALPHESPSAQGLIDAQGSLQVGVGPGVFTLPAPTGLVFVAGFATPVTEGPGCHVYTATAEHAVLELDSGQGGAAIAVTSSGTSFTTTLRKGALVSAPVAWPVQTGVPTTVATTVPDAHLALTLEHSGPVTVCS
jgi:hypothetical protein